MSESESNQTTTYIVLVLQHNLLNNISSSRKYRLTQITQQNMYRSLYIKHVPGAHNYWGHCHRMYMATISLEKQRFIDTKNMLLYNPAAAPIIFNQTKGDHWCNSTGKHFSINCKTLEL